MATPEAAVATFRENIDSWFNTDDAIAVPQPLPRQDELSPLALEGPGQDNYRVYSGYEVLRTPANIEQLPVTTLQWADVAGSFCGVSRYVAEVGHTCLLFAKEGVPDRLYRGIKFPGLIGMSYFRRLEHEEFAVAIEASSQPQHQEPFEILVRPTSLEAIKIALDLAHIAEINPLALDEIFNLKAAEARAQHDLQPFRFT